MLLFSALPASQVGKLAFQEKAFALLGSHTRTLIVLMQGQSQLACRQRLIHNLLVILNDSTLNMALSISLLIAINWAIDDHYCGMFDKVAEKLSTGHLRAHYL